VASMAPPLPQSSSALDGPPPSPQSNGGGPTGEATPFSLAALTPPAVPSNQMPPELLTGIMQSAQTIAQMFDSYAQATPDLAADWAQLKDGLAAVLAKLMQAGSGPVSPTATGPGFPGGGVDRGIAGAGAV
jgi:hypothetical protein